MTAARQEANTWQWKSLASLAADGAPILYGILQPGPNVADGVPYVRPTEIKCDVIDLNDIRRTNPAIAAKYMRSVLRKDDIVLSIVGTIGKVAIVPAALDGGNITQSSVRIRVRPEIAIPHFIAWALRSPLLFRQYEQHRLGTAVPRLNVAHVRELQIPLPPVDEQQRIVAEIEKQFPRLDAGVASLKRVQGALKRYRASVLKAACEGRLVPTEAEIARKENRSYETGEQLLQRILKERREKGSGKYKDPAPPTASQWPSLPEGWAWASVGQLFFLDSGEAFKKRDYSASGLRLLQIANVGFGKTIWEQQNFLPKSFRERHPDLLLSEGEIVIALNRPILNDRLKIAQIRRSDLPAVLYQRVGRLMAVCPELPPYFFYLAQSEFFVRQVQARLQGTDQPYLNTSLVPGIALPLPPLSEQNRIVAEIDRRLSIMDEVESLVATAANRSATLRRSILSSAFSATNRPR
jgi:type I restriction enzyme, S subunit